MTNRNTGSGSGTTGRPIDRRIIARYHAFARIAAAATTATGTWTGSVNGAAWTVNVDGSKFTNAHAASSNRWLLDCSAGILYGPTTTGIGDISQGLQARLLRALQEHEIVPLGSETPLKVDVRVVAATHRDRSGVGDAERAA